MKKVTIKSPTQLNRLLNVFLRSMLDENLQIDTEDENNINFKLIDKLFKSGIYYRYKNKIRNIYIYLIQKCDLPLATVEFLLEQIAQSRKADRRKFAARHPETPTSVLEILVEDEDRRVQEAAIFRLQQKQDN